MAHGDEILRHVANAEMRRKYEDQINNPLPKLGRIALPVGMVDMQLGPYVSEGLLDFPFGTTERFAGAPDMPLEVANYVVGGFDLSDTSKEATVAFRDSGRDAFRIRDELAAAGIYSGRYDHSITINEAPFVQLCIFVPVIKTEFVHLGGDTPPLRSTQTNLEQEAMFIAHLIKNGLVDPEQDKAQIIEAVGARGLHLATTKYMPATDDNEQKPGL